MTTGVEDHNDRIRNDCKRSGDRSWRHARIAAKRFLKERFQETITKAIGFAVIVMGLGSTLSEMLTVNIQGTGDQIYGSLDTQGVIMMIVSLVGGAFLGELITWTAGLNGSAPG